MAVSSSAQTSTDPKMPSWFQRRSSGPGLGPGLGARAPGQHPGPGQRSAGALGRSAGAGPLPAERSPSGAAAAAAPGPAGLDAAVGMQERTAHSDKIGFRTKCSGSQNLLLKRCRRRSRCCTPSPASGSSRSARSRGSSLGTAVGSPEWADERPRCSAPRSHRPPGARPVTHLCGAR